MQAYPPGLYQEFNIEMMEGLWYALAAARHPEVFAGNPQSRPSLQELFDKHLADVTWADFWHAFPYELRCGVCCCFLGSGGAGVCTAVNEYRKHLRTACAASKPGTKQVT